MTSFPSPSQRRRDARNTAIREEFAKLYKQELRSEVILLRIADKWCLATDTVYKIVRQQGFYSNAKPAQNHAAASVA